MEIPNLDDLLLYDDQINEAQSDFEWDCGGDGNLSFEVPAAPKETANSSIVKSETLNTLVETAEEPLIEAPSLDCKMTKIDIKAEMEAALKLRDFEIQAANDKYSETMAKLQENLDQLELCQICCAAKVTILLNPCLHSICKACVERMNGKCPWDRLEIVSTTELK